MTPGEIIAIVISAFVTVVTGVILFVLKITHSWFLTHWLHVMK